MALQTQIFISLWIDGELYPHTGSRVTKLDVEERCEGASSMSLTLDLAPVGNANTPSAERDWDLLREGKFGLLRQLTVELGVGPVGSPPAVRAIVFHGYITAVEPFFGEARVPDSSLTLHALDAGCLMHLEERTVSYSDVSDAQIVRQVYERYGLSVDIEETATVRSSTRGPLLQRTTDAELIRRLAERNGFEAYVERRSDADAPMRAGAALGPEVVGHFHAPRVAAAAQPVLELGPLETPSIREMKVRWESHRPTSIVAAHIDETTRRLRAVHLRESRFKPMASTKRSQIMEERLRRAVPKLPGLQAVARQLADVPWNNQEVGTLAWADFQEADFWVQAHAVVDGLRYPNILRARRPVEMRGAGKLLDGRWYVRSARHRWLRDAPAKRYEVDAELVRNALGGMG